MKNIQLAKILLQRKNLIEIKPKNITYEQDNIEKSLIVSILKNIQSLGFTKNVRKAHYFSGGMDSTT